MNRLLVLEQGDKAMDLVMFIVIAAFILWEDFQKGRRQGYRRDWWTRKNR